jgi:hypothetical protein
MNPVKLTKIPTCSAMMTTSSSPEDDMLFPKDDMPEDMPEDDMLFPEDDKLSDVDNQLFPEDDQLHPKDDQLFPKDNDDQLFPEDHDSEGRAGEGDDEAEGKNGAGYDEAEGDAKGAESSVNRGDNHQSDGSDYLDQSDDEHHEGEDKSRSSS